MERFKVFEIELKFKQGSNYDISFNFLMNLKLILYLYSFSKTNCMYIYIYIYINFSFLTKKMLVVQWFRLLDIIICLLRTWEQVSKFMYILYFIFFEKQIMFIQSLNFTSLLTLNIVKQSLFFFMKL